VAGHGRAVHGRTLLGIVLLRHGLLGLDVMILADADANALVREAAGQERGLGHAWEGFAGVDHERVGETGHDMDDLALNQLKEREAKAEMALNPY